MPAERDREKPAERELNFNGGGSGRTVESEWLFLKYREARMEEMVESSPVSIGTKKSGN
jgi:hypothetical protein